jgi:hypothetical protein
MTSITTVVRSIYVFVDIVIGILVQNSKSMDNYYVFCLLIAPISLIDIFYRISDNFEVMNVVSSILERHTINPQKRYFLKHNDSFILISLAVIMKSIRRFRGITQQSKYHY